MSHFGNHNHPLPPTPSYSPHEPTRGYNDPPSNSLGLGVIRSAYGPPPPPPPAPIISVGGQLVYSQPPPPIPDEEHRLECNKFISKCMESSRREVELDSQTPEPSAKRVRLVPSSSVAVSQEETLTVPLVKGNIKKPGQEKNAETHAQSINPFDHEKWQNLVAKQNEEMNELGRRHHKEWLESISPLIKENKRLGESIETLKGDLKNSSAEVKSLNEEVKTLEEDKSKLISQIESDQKKLERMGEQFAELKELREKNNKLNLELETAKKASETKEQENAKKLFELQKIYDNMKRSKYDMEKHLNEEITKMKGAHDMALVLMKKTQEDTVDKLEKEVENLRSLLNDHEKYKELKEAKAELDEKTINDLLEQIKEMDHKRNIALLAANSNQEESKRLREENGKLQKQLKKSGQAASSIMEGFVRKIQADAAFTSQSLRNICQAKAENSELPANRHNILDLDQVMYTVAKEHAPELACSMLKGSSRTETATRTENQPVASSSVTFTPELHEPSKRRGAASVSNSSEDALNLSVCHGPMSGTSTASRSSEKVSTQSSRSSSQSNNQRTTSGLIRKKSVPTPAATPPEMHRSSPSGFQNYSSPHQQSPSYSSVSQPFSRYKASPAPMKPNLFACDWCNEIFESQMLVTKHICSKPLDPKVFKQGR